jgi:hypothetical protein
LPSNRRASSSFAFVRSIIYAITRTIPGSSFRLTAMFAALLRRRLRAGVDQAPDRFRPPCIG